MHASLTLRGMTMTRFAWERWRHRRALSARTHGLENDGGYAARALKRAAALIVISVALCCVMASSALAREEGAVLPASAEPHGWSLTRMAGPMALFTTSGNDPAYYPKSPFQILYANTTTGGQNVSVGSGLDFIGSYSFTVPRGTPLFVPVWNADDSPPVVGTWPATHRQAVGYFFDPSQVGGRDFRITVDGHDTDIGRDYVAGPVTTAPLLDGGGTHFIMLGAFLHPLRPGTHTVSIGGGVFGAEVAQTYAPVSFFEEAISYTVTVR